MIGALIMVHGDDNGLILPPLIAPTQVVIIGIGDVLEEVNKIYDTLKNNNIRVSIDDSEKSPGFKFAEAEVNGIPIRIEIGARDLENNEITIARRDTLEKIKVDKDIDIVSYIKTLFAQIQKDMYNKALARMKKMTYEAKDLKDMENILNSQPGFIIADWCGSAECESKIKEIKGCKSRCILENHDKITGKCVVCSKEAKETVVWGIQY